MLEQKEPPEAPPEVLATTSVGDESQEETESAFGVLGQKNEGERKAEEFKVRTAEGSTGVSGEKFLQDYYHCLSNNLEKLSNFYHDDAVMTLQYGEETSSSAMDIENPLSPIGREIKRQPIVEGKEDIDKRLKYIYKDRKASVTSIDCQISSRGTMLLVASGTLDDTSAASMESPYGYNSVPFVQSFIVTCVESSDFKIMNDILKKLDPSANVAVQPVPQLESQVTPVIGGKTSESKVKSKSRSSSSRRKSRSSSSRKRERGGRRPTPKRLFQPVSLRESLVEGDKRGGNNIATLMTFIANLCEILVNSLWSAVAILHIVGTLSLLLSVSAMFLKSRNDLVALERATKEIEKDLDLKVDSLSGQEASHVVKTYDEPIGLTGAISMKAVSGEPIKFVSNGEKMGDMEQFYPERTASSALLASLTNGDFPVKGVGGLFKEDASRENLQH